MAVAGAAASGGRASTSRRSRAAARLAAIHDLASVAAAASEAATLHQYVRQGFPRRGVAVDRGNDNSAHRNVDDLIDALLLDGDADCDADRLGGDAADGVRPPRLAEDRDAPERPALVTGMCLGPARTSPPSLVARGYSAARRR